MDLDNRARGASPLWESRNVVVSERGVVNLVNENTKESGGLAVGIRFELGVDLDDKGGSDCREQTGLYTWSGQVHQTHVELTKIKVVFKSSSCFLRNSLSYSSATLR